MPHNVCVCKYYANLEFLLCSISGAVTQKTSIIKNLQWTLVLLQHVIQEVKEYINDKCEYCNTSEFQTTLHQWEANDTGYLAVTEKHSDVQQLVLEVSNQLPFFKRHVFIKKFQASNLKKGRLNTDSGSKDSSVGSGQINIYPLGCMCVDGCF